MLHRPWSYTNRLVTRMADSAITEKAGMSIRREPRSEGLHASTLLKELHPVGDGAVDEPQLRLFGLLGLAFEDRAELALLTLQDEADWPWYIERPGEVHQDGVACSPDILLIPKKGDASEMRELSLKVTWKSCAKLPTAEEGEDGFPQKFDYYLSQCMTYAMPLRTRGSVLLVYFVCGPWRPKPFPQVHGWELDFSGQEIGEQWDALMAIAKGMKHGS